MNTGIFYAKLPYLANINSRRCWCSSLFFKADINPMKCKAVNAFSQLYIELYESRYNLGTTTNN